MDSFKALIKLWKEDKHIPKGMSVKSLLPKKKDQVKSLHSFAMQPELISAVKLALSAMGTAWDLLENGVSLSEQSTLVDGAQLADDELLLIAHIVPLFIPKELGHDLQAGLPNLKRKHDDSDADETDGRTLDEILQTDDGFDYSAFFRSGPSKAKRARAISISDDDSDDDLDQDLDKDLDRDLAEDLGVEPKKGSAAKTHPKKPSRQTASRESGGHADTKATGAGEEGGTIKKEMRKILKPKSRRKGTQKGDEDMKGGA